MIECCEPATKIRTNLPWMAANLYVSVESASPTQTLGTPRGALISAYHRARHAPHVKPPPIASMRTRSPVFILPSVVA